MVLLEIRVSEDILLAQLSSIAEREEERGREIRVGKRAASSNRYSSSVRAFQMSVTKGLIDAFDDDEMNCVGSLRIMIRQSRLV